MAGQRPAPPSAQSHVYVVTLSVLVPGSLLRGRLRLSTFPDVFLEWVERAFQPKSNEYAKQDTDEERPGQTQLMNEYGRPAFCTISNAI